MVKFLMARPFKEIDWEKIKVRIAAGNTAAQIAFHHNLNIDTFYDRFKKEFGCSFSEYSESGYSSGDADLQYVQFVKALSGNIQCLHWLAQVRLGQVLPSSKNDIESSQKILLDIYEEIKKSSNPVVEECPA